MVVHHPGMVPSPIHHQQQNLQNAAHQMESGEEPIYWPKLQPNSPKLKVTFNEVTSMSPPPSSSTDPNQQHQTYILGGEHGGKR